METWVEGFFEFILMAGFEWGLSSSVDPCWDLKTFDFLGFSLTKMFSKAIYFESFSNVVKICLRVATILMIEITTKIFVRALLMYRRFNIFMQLEEHWYLFANVQSDSGYRLGLVLLHRNNYSIMQPTARVNTHPQSVSFYLFLYICSILNSFMLPRFRYKSLCSNIVIWRNGMLG